MYFTNYNTNNIIFKENTQNILGGVIFLNKDSLLNIKLENNSIAHLNFKIIIPINELFIGENSKVVISKNGIKTQTWIQKGDINLTIHLDDI